MNPSASRLPEIERLRGVAVLMVMVTHSAVLKPAIPELMWESWSGVDLFFVISGFVVSRSLVRLLPPLDAEQTLAGAFDLARRALRTFYVRRFFRIAPMAFAAVLFTRVIIELGVPGTRGGLLREAIAVFAGVYNYAKPTIGYEQLGVYWSLAIEEHFYLILPLLFLFARTRSRRAATAVLGVALIAFVIRPLFGEAPPGTAQPQYYTRFASHVRFDSLFAGVAAAMLFDGEPDEPVLPPTFMRWVILPIAIALIWTMPAAVGTPLMHRMGFISLWFLASMLVIYASFDRGYVLEVPVLGRVLEHVGGRSYALYLLHYPIYRLEALYRQEHPAFSRFVQQSDATRILYFGALLVLALLATELTWRTFEKPLQAFGRRLDDRSQPRWQPTPRTWMILAGVSISLLALFHQYSLHRWLGRRNLALGKPVKASSQIPLTTPANLTNGELEDERGFHTERDGNPSGTIDLESLVTVDELRVYNRGDGSQRESLPLSLELSVDGEHFTTVATRTTSFTQWMPWKVSLPGTKARYVRIASRAAYLCVAELEVFGQ